MNKSSVGFFKSVVKSVKKECMVRLLMIPNDNIIIYMLKLLTSISPILNDEDALNEHAKTLITSIVSFLKSNGAPFITIEIQMYFNEHHILKENILQIRHENIEKSTDPLLQHILVKQTIKNKEDADQLYHHISRYIVLTTGSGDPTDEEVLKQTMDALKSILSSKEIIRFASKLHSVKMKQLCDVCNIVTGITIYNKDSAKKTDSENDLFSTLEKSCQKCNIFLDFKLREVEERCWQMIRICLNYYTSKPNLLDDFECLDEKIDAVKSYVVLLQQILIYFRILSRECRQLTEEFQACCVLLEQRLGRVRKTVKSRTAIPVVEIYPQFKDISLSWNHLQDISCLLNHYSEIVFDIWKLYEKVPEPDIEYVVNYLNCDSPLTVDKQNVNVENSKCEIVTIETADDFYNIAVEYGGFCIIAFVETKGVLIFGIREYGLIKYNNKYYCFSTPANMNKFSQNPNKYAMEVKKLAFTRPETIHLLNIEKDMDDGEILQKPEKIQTLPVVADAEVQTEIHPIPSFKDHNYVSSVWQLQQRITHLAELKKYLTHSVQTVESNFRKNSSTQTSKSKCYK